MEKYKSLKNLPKNGSTAAVAYAAVTAVTANIDASLP